VSAAHLQAPSPACFACSPAAPCARCLRRRRLSLEKFGGLREAALARDGYRCRTCPAAAALVHHRRPGVNELGWIVSACRACHCRIHHTYRPPFGFPPALRALWREQWPGLAEQRELPFADAPRFEQAPLF